MIGNKPSIYNAPSVYSMGDKKTVWGGKPFEVKSNARVQIKSDSIILRKPQVSSSNSDSYYMGVEPIYSSEKTFGDLNEGDEIEINFVGLVKKLGTGKTRIFMTSGVFDSTSAKWNDGDLNFEINNYGNESWFKAFNNVGSQFTFDYNQVVRIHLLAKKTSPVTMSFLGWYNGYEKMNMNLTLDSTQLARTCLLTFGSFVTTGGFKTNSEIRPGSFIRYNDEILFGIK